jgi:hypothetical protein
MEKDSRGLDANTETGTRDKVDPETGAYGTAGTPVTTGKGESASTIGTGTEEGEQEYREGDFEGVTPESKGYSTGKHGDTNVQETAETIQRHTSND